MKQSIQLFFSLPKYLRKIILRTVENMLAFKTYVYTKKKSVDCIQNKSSKKINILFFHPTGLRYGGTEKCLQGFAKHINSEKYHVFFMHGEETDEQKKIFSKERKKYIESNPEVTFIPFSYTKIENKIPFFIHDMNPDIHSIIKKYAIDALVVAATGHTQYPQNIVRNIPIIQINIFGSVTAQKNIVKQICISHEVKEKAARISDPESLEVLYIPTDGPSTDAHEHGKVLRQKLGIPDSHVVFGRIGRPDNSIHDPIGIKAFESLSVSIPDIQYVIMAPPPALQEYVAQHAIPRVHYIEPSADEHTVWAFHDAIDILAHFRSDGESCGLNIIESLISGNPIITHKSKIWNAHLEYLKPSFSRVVDIDDWQAYATHMKDLYDLHKKNEIGALREEARNAGSQFLFSSSIEKFEAILESALQQKL